MSGEPTPIRPGIVPEMDYGRELIDFCTMKVASYIEEYASPPTCIAMVLSGEKEGKRHTVAYSWDASEQRTQLETCSVASAVLLKRAIS